MVEFYYMDYIVFKVDMAYRKYNACIQDNMENGFILSFYI